ncbi:hypothetical protein [Marinicella sp. W31]|uniref:hypothetical protein n=1 Tax=Marinicella sp. W31 TaxID=3023713 RepID=UPI003756657F
MKLFILITMLSYSVMGLSGGIMAADENLTVGPVEAGSCDYASIQDALDAISPVTIENIRVVAGTYNETLNIADQSINIIGGYADCAAAENDTRITGTVSTLDAIAHGMVISAAIDGDAEIVNITGLNVVNGMAGFLSSGGLNIIGEVNVAIFESRIGENVGNNGGGIYIENPATLFLNDTLVENNDAVIGGGVYCNGCTLLMNGASGISNNDANGNGVIDGVGGGLYLVDNAQASILSGAKSPSSNNYGIHNNDAADIGGGIYVEASELTLFGDLAGFGFGNNTDPVNVTNNSAANAGGGFYITDNSTVNATVIDISNNVSGNLGAGIYASGNSELNINLGLNTPLESCWTVDRTKCNRMHNNNIANGSETDGQGGAIRAINSSVNVRHVWFENNDAGEGFGAVIYHVNQAGTGLIMENNIMYENGFPTGQDSSLIHVISANTTLRFNTLVDNNISNEILRFIGGGDDTFNVENTIIHNNNSDTVLSVANVGLGNAILNFDCVLVHSDNSLPGSASDVFIGDPNFFDRDNGDLHLTSSSVLALDRCGQAGSSIGRDMDREDRQIDLLGENNDLSDFIDIGADEYIGNDLNLDIIFADGFEQNLR